MKSVTTIVLLGFVLAGCASFGSRGVVTIGGASELEPNVGRTVVVDGVYHDSGKGDRYLDCGFVHLTIADYSLYTEMSDGQLIPQVRDGERITVRGCLRFFPGSRIPSDEAKTLQASSDGEEIIDGRSYSVQSPRYLIEKIEVMKRSKERQPNQALQTTSVTRSGFGKVSVSDRQRRGV